MQSFIISAFHSIPFHEILLRKITHKQKVKQLVRVDSKVN